MKMIYKLGDVMGSKYFHVEEANLSLAWAKVMIRLLERGCSDITPLVVSIGADDNGRPVEDGAIRTQLDELLRRSGSKLSGSTASTIFPRTLWNPKDDRNLLYNRYLGMWEYIKKCPPNRHGTYFQRLIATKLAKLEPA
jgi:hypothetical protein